MRRQLAPLESIKHFTYEGKLLDFTPYGSGLINSTYLAVTDCDGRIKKYILQAINTSVFKDPQLLMNNILAITSYLLLDAKDPRSVLTPVVTKEGHYYVKDKSGVCWRMYVYVEDSISINAPETKEDFYESGLAFGRFQHDLADFPVKKLKESIPDFHNTPKRFAALMKAVEEDVCGRVKEVKEELDFIIARKDFCSCLLDANEAGDLPLRVSHNDTKINNVLFDRDTRKAVCVIDLDTVMPGFSVTDFGDAIRFGASTAPEDEPDLSKVMFDMELFETYTDGFLTGCGGSLPDSEIMLLPEGAKMMTFECGIRFLTDYLSGDTYFKTTRKGHNLDRCRTQMKLVAEMEAHWDEMKAVVEKYCKNR